MCDHHVRGAPLSEPPSVTHALAYLDAAQAYVMSVQHTTALQSSLEVIRKGILHARWLWDHHQKEQAEARLMVALAMIDSIFERCRVWASPLPSAERVPPWTY